jgi:hypothetical protein
MMTTTTTTTPASICTPCYMFAHYGDETFGSDETPDMRRDIVAGFETLDDAIIDDAHHDDCKIVVNYANSHDCTCYEAHFSWMPCDICNSTLGGDRHDVNIVSKYGG